MRPSSSEETTGNNDSREQEKSETPINPPSPDDKSRFLKRRIKKNVANDYHPSHNPKSIAILPEILDTAANEEDREDPLLWPINKEVPEDDMRRLKQELSHLPFDTVLRILSTNSYDVDKTIEMGRQMEVPDLVPQYVKDFYIANIAVERHVNPTRGSAFKHFYFAKDLKKVVNTPSLVNFYYNEKNKINGNWRLERPDPQLNADEKADLEERMKKNNISILTRDPSIPYKQTRGQKAAATRKANLLKKEQEAKEKNGEGSQEKDTDSDRNSVSSTDIPSTSDRHSFAGPSTSSASAPRPFRTRDFAPITRLSDTSNGHSVQSKKRWTKKAVEEKQIDPRRSYPGRLRKPPTFFE